MAEQGTLLSHLAYRYVTQRENFATDALCYLLKKSHVAGDSLLRLIYESEPERPGVLSFRTQAWGEDGAIPDLVGRDVHGRDVVILEAKFWAGLTKAQPTVYLKRLKAIRTGTLVFIAPAKRLGLLWEELLRRCDLETSIRAAQKKPHEEMRSIDTGDGVRLVILSWKLILQRLHDSMLEAGGEGILVEDLRQLQGLCNYEDTEAFLPLSSEELTSNVGRRVLQFGEVVDAVVDKLVEAGIADTKNLRSAAGSGWYGRYFRMASTGCSLAFCADRWASFATPLVLRVTGVNYTPVSWIEPALDPWKHRSGLRSFETDDRDDRFGGLEYELRFPIDKVRSDVVDAIEQQLLEVDEQLKKALSVAPEVASVTADIDAAR
ncbi:MAG: hypothetical protein K8U03_21780 [Planctomycetia bacterium]|nr:hypothetical protein [Planctomycetia bacterium]